MRIIGLDIGDRRIGVAMSDPSGFLASPLQIIVGQNDEQAIATIVRLVADNCAEEIVVGMPYALSGAVGPAASRVQDFVVTLRQAVKVPVNTWDERLSTVAADRSMRETGVKKRRQKELRDAIAAALILQGYLDRQRSRQP